MLPSVLHRKECLYPGELSAGAARSNNGSYCDEPPQDPGVGENGALFARQHTRSLPDLGDRSEGIRFEAEFSIV